jgi:hypothetical protein
MSILRLSHGEKRAFSDGRQKRSNDRTFRGVECAVGSYPAVHFGLEE